MLEFPLYQRLIRCIQSSCVLAPAVLAILMAPLSGCSERPQPTQRVGGQNALHDEVFKYAVGLLNGVVDYDPGGTMEEVLDWLRRPWTDQTVDRLIGGRALHEIVERFNQWLAVQTQKPDWKLSPLVERLPDELRRLPRMQSLDELKFAASDGRELAIAVWLRNLSRAICGDATSDVERASLLLDWTVRNIQLEAADLPGSAHMPWQILVSGRGGAEERAWIFILLSRQQGLDLVVLEPAEAAPDENRSGRLLGLVSNGELYLFDVVLGLPIPGPDGQGVATLAQVTADESLLKVLDQAPDFVYPFTSAKLAKVTAHVEGSPIFLSRAAAVVESHLAGDEKVTISIDTASLADRLRGLNQVRDVRLWELPLERLRQQSESDGRRSVLAADELRSMVLPFFKRGKNGDEPVSAALLKGRLTHIFGKLSGKESASQYYQLARPSNDELERFGGGAEGVLHLKPAKYLKLSRIAKEDASYWLGLVAYERKKFPAAIDYFLKRTLVASPKGPWTSGAHYNLARSYEAMAKEEEREAEASNLRRKAIEELRLDQSPQRHGNLIRARRLEQAGTTAVK